MSELEDLIRDRYINVQKHPDADLYIYNYTAKTQYEHVWNEHTLTCRGLIKDGAGSVVSRPFRKFFNLGSDTEIPNEPFEVYEKLDGSLGILYWLDDKPMIATRGSFISDQADRATRLLHTTYRNAQFDRDKTYLFEIIYPANRIVCDYGDREELVHLATIDTATGNDLPLVDVGIPLVKRLQDVGDVRTLYDLDNGSDEGFVVKFESGLRVKVKFAEYCRLHKLITQCSNVRIWETVAGGQSLDELIERVPDEFYGWVKQTADDLKAGYAEIENQCLKGFKNLGNRKETALYFQTQKYPYVLFAMLDGKDYSKMIWRSLRPNHSKPFRVDIDA